MEQGKREEEVQTVKNGGVGIFQTALDGLGDDLEP